MACKENYIEETKNEKRMEKPNWEKEPKFIVNKFDYQIPAIKSWKPNSLNSLQKNKNSTWICDMRF